MATTQTPVFDRRAGDSLVQVIATKLENLHGDVGDMKAVLKDLTAAVTKLAVVEERQGQATLAQERMFVLIEKMEIRVKVLELAAPVTAQTNAWVLAALGALGFMALQFAAKTVGLA